MALTLVDILEKRLHAVLCLDIKRVEMVISRDFLNSGRLSSLIIWLDRAVIGAIAVRIRPVHIVSARQKNNIFKALTY